MTAPTATDLQPKTDIAARLATIDWAQAESDLDAQGSAVLKQLFTPDQCRALALLYARLVDVANRWNAAMGIDIRYPARHDAFLKRCHDAGQTRPTPLLLQYGAGDYNCLHQDLYGEHVFPLQVAILLSEPGRDFAGGEFVLTEQRPRMQSRAEIVPLAQGEGVIFPVHHRPVQGTRGTYRVN